MLRKQQNKLKTAQREKLIKLTPSLKRALEIIKDSDYPDKLYGYRGFAEKMWPDSLMHHRSKNGVVGTGAWLCAGSYMGRLAKLGVVVKDHRRNGFYITYKGKELLKQNENGKEN
jgi:hypothetical protein